MQPSVPPLPPAAAQSPAGPRPPCPHPEPLWSSAWTCRGRWGPPEVGRRKLSGFRLHKRREFQGLLASLLQWRKLRAALGGWADWPKVTQPIDGGTKGPNCQLVLSPLFLLVIILPKKNKICCSKITWGSHCSFKTLSSFLAHGMCSVYIQNTINYYMVPNAPGKCGSCSIITNLRGGDK